MRQIFVFGSNLAGRHGAGAALAARQRHGAIYGVGRGIQGNSYGIPTKGYKIETLALSEINLYVLEFMAFAKKHPELEFNITRIGCGLAGYTDSQIAPMFTGAPMNCVLPEGWAMYTFPKSPPDPRADPDHEYYEDYLVDTYTDPSIRE